MITSLTRSLRTLNLTSSPSSLRSATTPTSSSRIPRSTPFSILATTARPRPSPTLLFRPSSTPQVRHKGNLAPRRVKYRKAHKGRIPVKIGGSIKGTTVQQGIYGIRVLEPCRLTAKQLQSAETALKRRLKVIKGAQVYMRVFPDVPVCVKGNETRMGKGKGAFEFWACRAAVGRVIFEVGGPVEIRAEVAKEALRLASAKLPVRTEFVSLASNPRLGAILVERHEQPASAVLSLPPSSTTAAAAAVAEVPLVVQTGSGQL
ncbi:hypothetical protein A4X09_0g6343 [Tilletia walkeri]|uniref:Ribosomal protein L10e/L16 domain-containing protein n=1 Tax=Tilletia walkeri TaxID=117179 RepID=A0A8X7N2Z9_9BASI|nr:hypothetical protein A4X09_0g6343 [Tilletia walkeri]